MNRSLGPLALLLVALAGCGGGGAVADANGAKAAAGLEEEEASSAAAKAAAPAAPAVAKIDPSLIPEPGVPLSRETYEWAGGSRDPFASVLDRADIGPELADLDVVSIYYIQTAPSTSVAVLRDRVSNKNYTVREGERLGRARATDIRAKEVSFTIDDYGTPRQVTLALRKREDIKP